ncbi:MAG: hypothetical protein ACOCWA_01790, partial [Bacteroidota bacterium]
MRILTFSLLFLFQGLTGQTSYFTRNIDWQISEIKSEQGTPEDITIFSSSYYKDFKSLYPWYYEKIPLNQNIEDFSLAMHQTKVQEFPKEYLPDYFIEELDTDFKLESHLGIENGKKNIQYSLFPFRLNPVSGKAERIVSFALKLDYQEISPDLIKMKRKSSGLINSPLATGDWYKVRVEEEGIHKITYNELIQLGISNPENVRVYGWGGRRLPEKSTKGKQHDFIEIPLYVEKGTDGVFNTNDFLLFYALGTVSWTYDADEDYFSHEKNPYSDYGYYFITSGNSPVSSPSDMELSPDAPDYTTESYDALDYHERDDVNLIKSGKEWYGEIFDATTERTFSFNIPSWLKGSPVNLKTNLLGRAKSESSYIIHVNNKILDTVNIDKTNLNDYTSRFANISSEIYSFTPTNNSLAVRLKYLKPDPTAQGWLDYLSVNARAKLELQDDQLKFRDKYSLNSLTTEYKIGAAKSSMKVWEISEYPDIKNVPGNFNIDSYSFRLPGNKLYEFIAFTPQGDYPGVSFQGDGLGKIENQ